MAIRIVFGAVALGREVVKWFKQDGDEEETHRWSRETRSGIVCARCAMREERTFRSQGVREVV